MVLDRYFDKEWRVEDIEKRGGTFVQKETLEKGFFRHLCEGTLYFGDGEKADLLVEYYPFGGGRVIGPAKKTPEAYYEYLSVIKLFRTLEQDSAYNRHAHLRTAIASLFNIIMIAFMVSCSIDILTMDIVHPVPLLTTVGIKLSLFLGTAVLALASRRI